MNVKVTPQVRAALDAIAQKWNDESVVGGPPYRATMLAQTALELRVWDMAVRHLGPERTRELRHGSEAPASSDHRASPDEPGEGDERMTPEEEIITDAIVNVVDDRLAFKERVYGKAWTGEVEDTEFIVSGAAAKVIRDLRLAGYSIVDHAATPGRRQR